MSHRLIQAEHVHPFVHGFGPIGRFNTWLAVRITRSVGSMWCAYAFACLALVSLPAAIISHDPVILVSWISQTFLQLVLLSVILVGQNVISASQDARAEADHETLTVLHEINNTELEILRRLDSGQGNEARSSGREIQDTDSLGRLPAGRTGSPEG